MSRKAKDNDGDSAAVIDVERYGLGDLAAKYRSPADAGGQWELPSNDEIVRDFARCGSQIGLFLKAIDPNGDRFSKQLALAAIMLQLKDDEAKLQEFHNQRNAGEDARLLLLEENAYEAAEFNPAAIKFLLEKRRGDKFGKTARDEGANEQVEALRQMTDRLRANPDRREE